MVPFDCAQGDIRLGKPWTRRPKTHIGATLRGPYGWFVTLPRAIIFRVYRSPSTES